MTRGRWVPRWVWAVALLPAMGCKESTKRSNPLDPIENSVGTFERGGDTLSVSTSMLHGCGERIRLRSPLVAQGKRASFAEGVVKEGFFYDDTCSGTLEPSERGLEVVLEGGPRCAKFNGQWTHDTNTRTRQAQEAIGRLSFLEAADLLHGVNKGDVKGSQAARNLLHASEMQAGLAWASERASVEKAGAAMVALVKLSGASATAGRAWLVHHADEACHAKLPRSTCLTVVGGVDRKGLPDALQAALHRVTEATGQRWLGDAAQLEVGPKAIDALAMLEDVCRLGEAALCEQANARASAARLRMAQREASLSHALAARQLLAGVKTTGGAPSQRQAQALLASTALTAAALEEAERQRRERGATDEVIAAFESVCGAGAPTPPCTQARKKADVMRFELGQSALRAGQYAVAEKRFAGIVGHGSDAAAKVQAILDSTSFRERLRAEVMRTTGQAAIEQCKEGRRDCEEVAQAALKQLGSSAIADEVRGAMMKFRAAATGSVEAVMQTEALIDRCGLVVEAAALSDVCFPPRTRFDAAGKLKPPSLFERAVLAVSNVLFGDEPSPSRATAAFGVMCAVLGSSLRMSLSMARRGMAAGGVFTVIAAVALLGAIIDHGLPHVGQLLDDVGIAAAP